MGSGMQSSKVQEKRVIEEYNKGLEKAKKEGLVLIVKKQIGVDKVNGKAIYAETVEPTIVFGSKKNGTPEGYIVVWYFNTESKKWETSIPELKALNFDLSKLYSGVFNHTTSRYMDERNVDAILMIRDTEESFSNFATLLELGSKEIKTKRVSNKAKLSKFGKVLKNKFKEEKNLKKEVEANLSEEKKSSVNKKKLTVKEQLEQQQK